MGNEQRPLTVATNPDTNFIFIFDDMNAIHLLLASARTCLSCLMLLLLTAIPLSAQWSRLDGPPGGVAQSIHEHDGILYLSMAYGTYRSSDGGTMWQPITTDSMFTIGGVSRILAFDDVLIATTSWGMFRSSDNGISWQASNNGMPINPAGYGPLVSGIGRSGNTLIVTTNQGAFRSTDIGQRWSRLIANDSSYAIGLIVTGDTIVLTGNQTYKYSTDAGTTWSLPQKHGLDSMPAQVAGRIGTWVYASSWSGEMVRSSSNGLTWEVFRPFGNTSNVIMNSIVAWDDRHIAMTYAHGLIASTDAGETWRPLPVRLDAPYEAPIVPGYTYAQPIMSHGNVLYICHAYGASRLAAGDSVAQRITGVDRPQVQGVASFGDSLIVGAQRSGLWLSTDRGTSWAEFGKGLHEAGARKVFATSKGWLAGTNIAGLWRRNSNETHWSRVALDTLHRFIAGFASFSNRIYCGTNAGLLVSTDDGDTWNTLALPVAGRGVDDPVVIADTIVIIHDSKVYRSSDAGLTWQPAMTGYQGRPYHLVVYGTEVYSANLTSEVFRSTDAGSTWQRMGSPVYTGTPSDIVVDGTVVYLTIPQANYTPKRHDIVRSTDSGRTWESIQGSLSSTIGFASLAIHQGTLYAGSNGVWRYSTPGNVSAQRTSEAVQLTLGPLLPNPATDRMHATITLFKPGVVRVEIFDQIGERVEPPLASYLQSGTHTFSFDIGNVSAGVYHCRVSTLGGSMSRSFTVVR